MSIQDPRFWRAGAISTTAVMLVVLAFLTWASLGAITAGGAHVPGYDVINRQIGYRYDWNRRMDMPTVGDPEPLFGRTYSEDEARALIDKDKLVIQSRS
ncbi:MAG: hypothetical protein ACM3ZT_09945 [Bacillota bacterium]